MDKQLKQENNDKNSSKNKKKNKNKSMKRLMNLFRGPKADNNYYIKANDNDIKVIKELIRDVLTENPFLKLHSKKSKDKNNDNEIDSQTKITDELVLGLNSILRCIQRKTIIGLIITDPLASHLSQVITELCEQNSIPCLSVESFDEIKTDFNISSLSAMGFKPNISSNDSKFNNLYKTFREIFDKNGFKIENISEIIDNKSIEISEKMTKTCIVNKNEINVNENLYDILYTKDSDDNYLDLMSAHINSNNSCKIDVIESQQSFLPFSGNSDIYFPERQTVRNARIEVIVEEQIGLGDDSFAQSLMDPIFKNKHKVMKRKSCQEYEANKILCYKVPEIVRLESSQPRIENRRQRKASKNKNKSK